MGEYEINKVEMSGNLKGIIPPTVTPLLSNGELDKKATERLTKHLLDGGVHGVFILGTTGEISSLKPSIKKELISLTCRLVDRAVPVIVGITHTALDSSLKFAKVAKENGADYVVAAPPFFFPLDQQDILAYYKRLADLSPLPLFLYNFPVMTKCSIEPDTVEELSKHSNVVGIKDSSGNGVYFQNLLSIKRANPEFNVFVGPEELLVQSVYSGADGAVAGGANIFPSLYVKLYKAVIAGDQEKINRIQPIIMEISRKIYACSGKSSSYLSGIKESLYYLGICESNICLPMLSVDNATKEQIRQNLEKIIFKIKTLE